MLYVLFTIIKAQAKSNIAQSYIIYEVHPETVI